MMESSENIDRYFKDKLENYKESPPQDTWDKIANQLGHRRKRKMVIFISRIAAGITILLSLSIFLYFTQKGKPGELAHQTDTITGIKSDHPDKSTVQISERQIENMENELSGSGTEGITSRDKSEYSGMTGSHTVEQISQPGRISEDDMIRRSSAVENMASTPIPVSETISYLMPIECEYLDVDYSGYDQPFTALDFRIRGQAHQLATDQIMAFIDEETVEKERQTAWLIGGQFAPLYSYRDLKSESYQNYVKDQINSKESGILAYAGGINFAVSPLKRLSIQGGFYYSKYGQEKNSLEFVAFLFPDPTKEIMDDYAMNAVGSEEQTQAVYIGNSTGKIMAGDQSLVNANRALNSYLPTEQNGVNQLNSSLPIRSITQFFEYLEVPLNLKYKVLDKKFDVSLMGGISTNFLVGTDIQLNYTDNSSKNADYTTEGLNQINYSGLLGIGFEYPLLKNLILNVEPKFRYYMNAIDKEQVYDIHPYSIGIFSGVSYVF